MGGTSVKAGKLEVKFPPQIKPKNDPIEINTPPAYFPEIPGEKKTMRPTIIVPEIIYPEKKKRIIVHHNKPFFHNYNNMFYGKVNPLYAHMAQMNPYWAESNKMNPEFQKLIADPTYQQGMKEYEGIIPVSSSKAPGGSTGAIGTTGTLRNIRVLV